MDDYFKQGLKIALNYLERSERFENEVYLKLQQKEIKNDTIDKILCFLREKKFLNDDNVLKNVIDYRIRVKREGKLKIIQNLMKRGVEKEKITLALENISIEDKLSSAVLCLEKKFKKDFDRIKGYRFLANRGYESSTIKEALTQFEKYYEEL